MRNYVPQKNNICHLPHNLYMQMVYLIRDYDSCVGKYKKLPAGERLWQWRAVEQAEQIILEAYQKRPGASGTLKPRQAFFEYAYYSLKFMQHGSEMGASKRAWNLYRSRFAYFTAAALGLVSGGADNHHDL